MRLITVLRAVSAPAWLLVLGTSCDGAEPNAGRCEPGETRTCVGPGACEGAQSCRADASGWEACDCGTGTGGSPGTPGSEGTGGGADDSCSDAAATGSEGLVDNLNDGDGDIPKNDGRTGSWTIAADGTGTVDPEPLPPVCDPTWQLETTDGAACMSGAGLTDWGANFTLVLNGPTGCVVDACLYDVRAYTGIRFTVSGSTTGSVRFNLQTRSLVDETLGGTCEVDCWDLYGFDLDLTEEPQVLEIAFSELAQAGWGAQLPWDPSDVIALNWLLTPPASEPLSFTNFCVDDVEFY